MDIYTKIEEDWQTYCLMSAIIYIEEMSKPTPHTQIKRYKDKKYIYRCFHTIRLKMKSEEFPKQLLKITKNWERKKKEKFMGKSFKKIRKEKSSGQYMTLFTPRWLNKIIAECGKIPNNYSFETAVNRIDNLVQYKKILINKNKFLFYKLLKNKELAAGAFIVSMDLEFRGIQNGRLSLCMSEKYKDFLEFMLKVAQKWKWTNNKELSKVNVDYSKRLGINASPQYEFRINMAGLKEIYDLAGPLIDSNKNNFIQFNIKRSNNYLNLGGNLKKRMTKNKILNALRKNKELTTTNLQFVAGVGTDVILDHLHKLEKEGKVKKERNGKRYNWSIKCQ